MRVLACLAALPVLAACTYNPNPPTLTQEDVAAAADTQGFLESRPETSIAAMPTTGTANYTGRMSADLTGDSTGSILADVTLTTNYETASVTGGIGNINTFHTSGLPDQRLEGDVPLTGTVVGNKLTADGSGVLRRVDNNHEQFSRMSVDMQGQFRTNTAPADTVTGSVTGGGNGSGTGAVGPDFGFTFDFTLANGVFYAE